MTSDEIASLVPALAEFLTEFRPYFPRETSFSYLQKYMVGLLSDLNRKSIEPMALAAGVPVRTFQEFLSFFDWDEQRLADELIRQVAEQFDSDRAIGVFDGSGHVKQGTKTPGVQRQWCGEVGKTENCVIGHHLLYTDRHPTNPFSCMLASDLYLPKSWAADRERCRVAKIPEDVDYRPGWRILVDQLTRVIANRVRLSYVTFDEEFGNVTDLWFELDRLGQRAIGEVKPNFYGWTTLPKYASGRSEFAPHRVDDLVAHSPAFYHQSWQAVTIKDTTRGPAVWQIKHAPLYLPVRPDDDVPVPTDRTYWLIVARQPATGEVKYFVSNAPLSTPVLELLEVAFARWHVEQWFGRAKQEAGLGAFEVRTYRSLIRHWLICRLAMFFLARETRRLREKKSPDHTGTSRGGGQHPDGAMVEPLLANVAIPPGADGILAMA